MSRQACGPNDLSTGQCATLACLLEASAPKPGNVHRGADFEDLTYYDFVSSAVAIAPAIDAAPRGRLGPTVLAAVEATRRLIRTNSNLGTILLIAPLAMVTDAERLRSGVAEVLATLDADDARLVYEAIRLARPGGMGRVEQADVQGPAPADLIAAMALAASRDLIARQYCNDFDDLFDFVVPALAQGFNAEWPIVHAIVHAHLRIMAALPDSLIARKCGIEIALEGAARAGVVLEAGTPGQEDYHAALADFDFWLRADGHRRNPGTTADLIAAGLFVALRQGIIELPLRFF